MSWVADTTMRFQFFAIAMTFMCPAFLMWMASDTKRQIASASWPSVTGEVQGTNAKAWSDREYKTKYFGRVSYRYIVDGKEYTTDLTDLGPGSKRSNPDAALADVRRFEPGMKVTVFYDPIDPSVGIIEKGVPTSRLLLLIGLGTGTLVGVVVSCFTAGGWIQGLRRKRNEVRLRQRGEGVIEITATPVQDAQLGERIEVFKPMVGNIVAGFIISFLLIAGGAAAIVFPLRAAFLADWVLPVDAKHGWSWIAVGLFALLGVGATAGGVALAAFSRALMSHCVEICDNGFRYVSRRSTDNVLWTGINRIKETILYERPPILKGPAKLLLPKVASTSYTVVTESGKEYGFNGNSVKAIKRFGVTLGEQAKRLSLLWETVESHG